MTIVGRQHAVELVRQVMTCPDGPGNPPVLVFEGDRGSGRTALLTSLAELLDGRVPYAHIDLGAGGPAGVPELLSALAFRLGRPCPVYGTLHFPRLAVGQLVMNETGLDLTDRDNARAQINALLRAHRRVDQVVATLRESAGNLPAGLPAAANLPTGLVAQLLAAVIDRLAKWAWSSRFVLGKAQRWYGANDRGRHAAVEALLGLNLWHQNPDEANNARRRDELLWAAFREDLRSSLGRRARRPWMPRCVVLIDNADTRLGRYFLTEIVKLPDTPSTGPEPLAVVATAREPFLDQLPPADQRVVAPGEQLAATRPAGGQQSPGWLRYPLADLTEEQVARKLKVDHPGLDHRIPLLVQQIAQGGPLATGLLLDAAGRTPAWPAGGGELGLILDQPERRPSGTDEMPCTVGERI
ncbi:MAG TPA: hypothetical protein VGD43_07870, partial [Micromonospora sp.]